MLVDDVTITIKAGNGGHGSASLKRNAQTAKGGPDGGNAGNGGNVYFQGVDDILGLRQFRFKKKITAEDGINGGKNNLYGRNGEDTIITVPLGTRITDIKTNETIEVLDTTTHYLLAKGGKGGRGNNEFKTATNQTPRYAEPGEPGEEKQLHLTLRIIADIGLIGLPNAGKSSLLSALTNAHPKIGAYPFTTLEPNLGVMDSMVLADIPGLIEGASGGKGLGIQFLKHIEKTKVLVHCIAGDSEDVKKTYNVVRKELGEYTEKLLTKPEIILLTKIDLLTPEEIKKRLSALKSTHRKVFTVSIYDDASVEKLRAILAGQK